MDLFRLLSWNSSDSVECHSMSLDSIFRLTTDYYQMSVSCHTHQIACDKLGQYISIGPEDSGVPCLSPLQASKPPTYLWAIPTPLSYTMTHCFLHLQAHF